MVAVEVERMLRLAEQCLERAKSFIGKSTNPPDLPASISTFSPCSSGQSEPHQSTVVPVTTASYNGNYIPLIRGICFINIQIND